MFENNVTVHLFVGHTLDRMFGTTNMLYFVKYVGTNLLRFFVSLLHLCSPPFLFVPLKKNKQLGPSLKKVMHIALFMYLCKAFN